VEGVVVGGGPVPLRIQRVPQTHLLAQLQSVGVGGLQSQLVLQVQLRDAAQPVLEGGLQLQLRLLVALFVAFPFCAARTPVQQLLELGPQSLVLLLRAVLSQHREDLDSGGLQNGCQASLLGRQQLPALAKSVPRSQKHARKDGLRLLHLLRLPVTGFSRPGSRARLPHRRLQSVTASTAAAASVVDAASAGHPQQVLHLAQLTHHAVLAALAVRGL